MAQYKNENGTWYIRCRNPVTGKVTTIRRNAKTREPFKTKKEAKDYENHLISNKIDISMTLNKLMELYLEDHLRLHDSPNDTHFISWYKTNVEPVLGRRRITGLKVKDLENLAVAMKKKGLSISYNTKMTGIIKTMLNFAVEHGYIDKNPVANYKPLKDPEQGQKIRYWTPEEMQVILESIPQRYKKSDATLIRQVLTFAYLSGLRKSEIRAMKWNQIDLKNNIIHVNFHMNDKDVRAPGRKNRKPYDIYMSTQLREIVDEVYNTYKRKHGFSKTAFVFPSQQSGFKKPLGNHTPTRWVQQLAEFNKMDNITFHGCRHSFVSYCTSICKLSPYEVAELIGDTVEVVLRVYHDFFTDQKIMTAKTIDRHMSNLSFLSNNQNSIEQRLEEIDDQDIAHRMKEIANQYNLSVDALLDYIQSNLAINAQMKQS